jgi:hypothetical protein
MPKRGSRFVHPDIRVRILLAEKLNMLLNQNVPISLGTGSFSLSVLNIGLASPVFKCIRENPPGFNSFLVYLRSLSTGFNLRECSSKLNISLFDALLMLIGALEMDLLEFPHGF